MTRPGKTTSHETATGGEDATSSYPESGTVHIVTFEGKHETTIRVFCTPAKAHKAKADWYRERAEPDELHEDDDTAIEQFEQDGGDYRAWINSADVE